MKKVILVCAAGMSSSLMAKKATEYLQKEGHEVQIDATTVAAGDKFLNPDIYDLVLVSPQMRMKYDELAGKAEKAGLKVAQIPFTAYAPIPKGIKELAELTLANL